MIEVGKLYCATSRNHNVGVVLASVLARIPKSPHVSSDDIFHSNKPDGCRIFKIDDIFLHICVVLVPDGKNGPRGGYVDQHAVVLFGDKLWILWAPIKELNLRLIHTGNGKASDTEEPDYFTEAGKQR